MKTIFQVGASKQAGDRPTEPIRQTHRFHATKVNELPVDVLANHRQRLFGSVLLTYWRRCFTVPQHTLLCFPLLSKRLYHGDAMHANDIEMKLVAARVVDVQLLFSSPIKLRGASTW